MPSIRVLHVITGLATGGAETMLLKLVAATAGAGVEHYVLSLAGTGPIASRIRDFGTTVEELHLRTVGGLLRFSDRSVRFAQRARPSVVHGWMYHGNVFGLMVSRLLGYRPPIIWGIRQALYDLAGEKPTTRAVIRLGARMSAGVDLITYNSEVSRSQHRSLGYAASRDCVIPNGFDLSRFAPNEQLREQTREALGIEPGAFVVGIVGRYHPVKDHRTFFAACAEVRAADPAARFIVAGPGCGRGNAELLALVRQHGLEGRALLAEEWSDMASLYPALDVLCVTSVSEGFPNVVGEAMACAVPCVVTDVGDCPVVVGDAGFVVPKGRADAIARAIADIRAMTDADRRTLGARARARVQRHFAIESVAAEYTRCYERVLERRVARTRLDGY